jgi:hypothetical protein
VARDSDKTLRLALSSPREERNTDMVNRSVLTFALAMAGAVPASAQPAPAGKAETPAARAEVLMLGTYHMANPGHDIFNMQADDVLAPKRQTEITEVIEVLKRFQPTKIAVERDAGDTRLSKDYADYLAGRHDLTRNEIEQIGFRLAKELGHKTVCAVDADGDFPYQRLKNYAKASGRSKEFDAIYAEIGDMVREQGAYLASHTVLETLLFMNSDEEVTRDVGFYFRQAHIGEPYDWAGAELVSEWFRRNVRIFTNFVQLADTPNERILVIFGSGHLGWLRHDVASDPTLRLHKLAEFAK